MDVFDTIYSVLSANGGKIQGRTVIQKLVYLSSKLIPTLVIPSYEPHYFGPFSSGLGQTLEKLVSYSFVSETGIPGTYERYSYGLTADGEFIAKKTVREHKETYEKIAKIVRICDGFCGLKTAPLSYASKIHHMLESPDKDSLSFEDAVDYARQLGWNVPRDNVDQGVQLLEKLKLDKIK